MDTRPLKNHSLLRQAILLSLLLVGIAAGCSRNHYRVAADRDVGRIVNASKACEPWELPHDWAPYPDPRSRFYDPTNPNRPRLPIPAPKLNAYRLPPLATGDPEQTPPEPLDPSASDEATSETGFLPPVRVSEPIAAAGRSGGLQARRVEPDAALSPRPLPPVGPAVPSPDNGVRFAAATAVHLAPAVGIGDQEEPPPATPPEAEVLPTPRDELSANGATAGAGGANSNGQLRITPVPASAWRALPEGCLARMLEFESVREEYRRTFERTPAAELLDDAPRLTLENLVELAIINNRDYQTRKETLYRVALRLSAEQYEYELRPVPFGNGTDLFYRHQRVGGRTVNSLDVDTAVAVQKTTRSAGQFLARFANDIALTFNGPQGFAADVGSELLFDFQQTVFQRDVVFEQLTQAQRDVVYAARDLIRFRKQLFRDIAARYYNLLLVYRGIEINSQDYFSNLRGFLQAQAEFEQGGRIPRIQVDQFEQNALASRSSLVGNCNDLESSLDQLKLLAGLPPEMPLNLDLRELETITLSDETTVAAELVRRTERLMGSRDVLSQPEALLGSAGVLADRIRNILRIRAELAALSGGGEETSQPAGERSELDARLERVQNEINLLDKIAVARNWRARLSAEREAGSTERAFRVLSRTIDLIEAQLAVTQAALPLVEEDAKSLADQLERLRTRLNEIVAQLAIDRSGQAAVADLLDRIEGLLPSTEMLLADVDLLADRALAEVTDLDTTVEGFPRSVREVVDDAVEMGAAALADDIGGLPPLEVEQEAMMLTALVQRLDLANARGDLADEWRQIKLAGDDLRSILDLQATQIIRTRSDINSPFAFTFDDSETRLRMSLDTPLNRRLQRNAFRSSLLNYNAALRNLINAEDAIKFDVREDLRQLALDREQYDIAISSAALAYERVVSTRLQLELEREGVAARDFLEAQQAYTASLSAVARRHIAYTIDRIELFFDVEEIETDPYGFWQGLRQEELQPPVNFDFPGTYPRPYGRLPQYPHYSPTIESMRCVPPGEAKVFRHEGDETTVIPAPLLPRPASAPENVTVPAPQ